MTDTAHDSVAYLLRSYLERIEKLEEMLRGTGANRYWEGRWRDEKAENERLRSEFKRFMGICGEGAELSRAIDFIDKADWDRARRAVEGGK